MRRVTHKALLVVQQALQSQHHAIGGLDQGQQFTWGARGLNGGQVAFGAGLQPRTQAADRPDRALHHHHHHQGDQPHQHGLPP